MAVVPHHPHSTVTTTHPTTPHVMWYDGMAVVPHHPHTVTTTHPTTPHVVWYDGVAAVPRHPHTVTTTHPAAPLFYSFHVPLAKCERVFVHSDKITNVLISLISHTISYL